MSASLAISLREDLEFLLSPANTLISLLRFFPISMACNGKRSFILVSLIFPESFSISRARSWRMRSAEKDMVEEIKRRQAAEIIVRPNSRKTRIAGYDEKRKAYIVEVNAPPEKGKANAEVVKLFSRIFGKKACIISGTKSRKKTVKAE